jgi:hypothetical protein
VTLEFYHVKSDVLEDVGVGDEEGDAVSEYLLSNVVEQGRNG